MDNVLGKMILRYRLDILGCLHAINIDRDGIDRDIYIDENCGLLYKALIDQGVADALAARDVDRSMNGDDSHNSGTGVRRQAPLAHECTYPDFIKCKPLYFKGTKGVVELTHCLKNETVSRYKQLTDVGHDVAYAMTWTNLKKMMTDKYCPRGEIKKLEVEMWNLKVKGTYVHSCSRQARLRGKLDNINQAQQQPPKKQGVAIAYTAGSSKRKEYAGTLPLCNKCKFHHNGQCTNRNHENQAESTEACGMVYALGGGETDQDPNNIKDEIEA
ncbi:hypothetical protein Tco_0822391 [Tanacetum coccineum]|uniref:Reverse transcriptase domain-containing protein n=1 Tax=Tanacetum coccineum TaxID=301880 RepID=A0ABQ5AHY0_9ASTR